MGVVYSLKLWPFLAASFLMGDFAPAKKRATHTLGSITLHTEKGIMTFHLIPMPEFGYGVKKGLRIWVFWFLNNFFSRTHLDQIAPVYYGNAIAEVASGR